MQYVLFLMSSLFIKLIFLFSQLQLINLKKNWNFFHVGISQILSIIRNTPTKTFLQV